MMEYKQSFEEFFPAVQEQVKLAKRRKTYARDVLARYPVFRSKTTLQGAHVPSICVERVEAVHDYKASHGSELTLVIRVIVHAASMHDRDGAKLVLEQAQQRFPRLAHIWADGGYAGKLVQWVKDT